MIPLGSLVFDGPNGTGDGKNLYFSRKTKEGWRVLVADLRGSNPDPPWSGPDSSQQQQQQHVQIADKRASGPPWP